MPRRRRSRKTEEHKPELRLEMLEKLWLVTDTTIDDIEEWFREPWADGRNAVRLALAGAKAFGDGEPHPFLEVMLRAERSQTTSTDYDRVDGIRYEASRSEQPWAPFVEAASVILMNWLACSDGGGHVPNGYLARTFWPALRDGWNETVALELVGSFRALDRGLHFASVDEASRLFRWLWLNRRYRLAMLVSAS